MATIYRKYRPQTFSDVSGQEHITKTITNEIAQNKVAHAYLFSGPRGIGKTTTARLLAKAINCQNRKEGEFEPCNECSSCNEINSLSSIDIIEIDAASHTGVDNVRENIIDNAQFKPTKSKYKVFIIDEVHMLSTSAFNALLKTLEEPPNHAIFILATTELHKLLPTIISRCQRFTFGKIRFGTMEDRLEKIAEKEGVKIEKEVYQKIINKSDGCLRDAESLLGQILSLNLDKISGADAQLILPSSNVDYVIGYLESSLLGEVKDALEIIEKSTNEGGSLEQFLYDLLEILRSVLLIKNDFNQKMLTDYSEDTLKKIKNLSEKIETNKLIFSIEKTLTKKQQLKLSPLPQLPLELLAVEINNYDQIINTTPVNNTKSTGTKEKTEEQIEEKKTNKVTSGIKTVVSKITNKYKIESTLEDVKKIWPEVKKDISVEFHSIGLVLNMCELLEISSRGLKIAVPYTLHKEKLEELKIKQTIEDALQQKLNEKIPIYCQIKEEAKTEDLDNLAADFGGEVMI